MWHWLRANRVFKSFDPYSRTNQLIVDGTIFTAAFGLAFLIRFEGKVPWEFIRQFLHWLPYLVAARLIVNWRMGIYRFIWRCVSLPDAVAIARSLSVVTAGLAALRLFYPSHMAFAYRLKLPFSIIAMDYLFSLLGSLSARALRRVLYERGQRRALHPARTAKRVLLYGAGSAGVMLIKELQKQPEVEVVGFVDDDPKTFGTVISGARVLGDGEALAHLVASLRVDEVVVSVARADRKVLARIAARCEEIPVPAKIIPSFEEIFRGGATISQVRELRMEDLLDRQPVEVSGFDEEVRKAYGGRRILVTGAGGSIGSELVRQLLLLEPAVMILLDKDENSTYELQQEVLSRFPQARVETLIADVRHTERLEAIFAEFKPEIVFHAAAHKHVPLMERSPCEAVLNNVMGTRAVLETCRRHGTARFVFISTDKAVSPTSVMGATKSVGELLVQTYAGAGAPEAACVRFGNVMGSRGSVIPLFQRQIAQGGPITVTHPDVVRFFMTIPEAVQLVISAGTLGRRGEVFVMDMGDPVKVLDLAKDILNLAGLQPGRDIEIAITGLRPGEKLVEELVRSDEILEPTRFAKLSQIVPRPDQIETLNGRVDRLIGAAQGNDSGRVIELLAGLGIGFRQAPSAGNSGLKK
jgi:FlaA1/EpsC-like NDP-sugar epimerase